MYMHKLKEKLGILSSIRDHRKKKGKQGRSPTPADILVNILSLIQSPRPRLNLFTSISAGVGDLPCSPTFFL